MKLNDKIRGAFYGMALGDALGLGTELMTREEVGIHYPEGLHTFSQIIKDSHRSQWNRGQWSNDTELILIMLESIMNTARFSPRHYAKSLKVWYESNPVDVMPTFRMVMSIPDWEESPIESAHNSWRKFKMRDATNEAINRAIVTGIYSGPLLTEDTRKAITMTHADTRCVSSALIIAYMAQSLLYNDRAATLEELEDLCSMVDTYVLPFIHKAYKGKIEDFELDDMDTMWSTRKAMGAALWCIINCNSPEEILDTVISAGGDADTNACLAMGLAGLKFGYDALPEEKEKLYDRERLEDIVSRFSTFMTKKNSI